jgi:hypothetical protein
MPVDNATDWRLNGSYAEDMLVDARRRESDARRMPRRVGWTRRRCRVTSTGPCSRTAWWTYAYLSHARIHRPMYLHLQPDLLILQVCQCHSSLLSQGVLEPDLVVLLVHLLTEAASSSTSPGGGSAS